MGEDSPLFAMEETALAFAYKTSDDKVHLDYVQSFSTANTENFTGRVLVTDWNGEPKYQFQYANGDLIVSPENGRSESCTPIHYYECTSVSSGGVDFGGHCNLVGVSWICLNDPPKELEPADFGNGGNHPDGNGPTLCPHPFIEGEFIPCDTCAEGYAKDDNGNCVKVGNDYKLCANSISFIKVGDAYTAEVDGLGASVVHETRRRLVNAEFGTTCLTMKTSNSFGASHQFAIAYNAARDDLDTWVQTQNPDLLTSWLVNAQLKIILSGYLNAIGGSYFTTGECQGDIPKSIARYDVNC